MKLAIGTNFDNNLIDLVKDTNVDVLYGKLSSDLVGGGRPTFALPKVQEEQVSSHIEKIHNNGLKFNYLLNATCLDNRETTAEFNKEFDNLLAWLRELKVDYITLSIPLLIERVRKILPDIKISLSTFVNVNSVQQAKYFESMGVSEITLPESRNRDFDFLFHLRKNTNCEYQLIATNDCLFSCPLRTHHANFQSHASQKDHILNGFAFDYCMLKCTQTKIANPIELLKSPWIRPEDTIIYEELGYKKFKLTERLKTTSKIAETAISYSNRSFDGNLLTLLNSRISQQDFTIPDFSINMQGKYMPEEKMVEVYGLLFAMKAYLDNKKLDGFLEGFKGKRCEITDCGKCGYCKSWISKCLTIDDDSFSKLESFEKLFDNLSSGDFYKPNDKAIWSEESEALFEKFLSSKPGFIRITAEKLIRAEAEKNAMKNEDHTVREKDVIKANLECTPDDFRSFALADIKAAGFNIEEIEGR